MTLCAQAIVRRWPPEARPVSQTASVWLVICWSRWSAANLPFVNRAPAGAWCRWRGAKSLALRLAELVVLYFVVGGIGLLFESRVGQIAPQGWEFYAVTGALFIMLRLSRFHLALSAASTA